MLQSALQHGLSVFVQKSWSNVTEMDYCERLDVCHLTPGYILACFSSDCSHIALSNLHFYADYLAAWPVFMENVIYFWHWWPSQWLNTILWSGDPFYTLIPRICYPSYIIQTHQLSQYLPHSCPSVVATSDMMPNITRLLAPHRLAPHHLAATASQPPPRSHQ